MAVMRAYKDAIVLAMVGVEWAGKRKEERPEDFKKRLDEGPELIVIVGDDNKSLAWTVRSELSTLKPTSAVTSLCGTLKLLSMRSYNGK